MKSPAKTTDTMSHASPENIVSQAPPDSRFGIVCSRWNSEITDRLLEGARQTLREAGVAASEIIAVRVPGAFELPVMASQLAKNERLAGVICLGVVIKGDTDHDIYINTSVANALQSIAIETGCPVSFGLLTCQTRDQALARAGGEAGHKGVEAAQAAIEMAHALRTLAK